MPTPPYPLHPEPISKGWIERHPGWKIPLGCLILFLLVGGFVTILLTGILASFHSSDVYNQALARAAADPQVRAQLGEPIHPGWFISGQMNVSGSTGNADLSIPDLRSARQRRHSRGGGEERGRLAVHHSSGEYRGLNRTCRSAVSSAAGGTGILELSRTPRKRKCHISQALLK